MKWFLRGLLFLVIALGVVLLLNVSKIKRLMTVNTLFDADKIVQNFSNMDAAFLHHDLTISEPQAWPEKLQDMPDTVMIAGQERALSEILEELDTTGLVVIKEGTLIHESYYKGTDKDDLRISWSVAKSFMSGLYGQALQDGLIESLDDPADKYVPSLKGSAYEGVSLRNILNMSSGVKFNEDYMDPKSDINDMGRILGLGGSMDDYTATLKGRAFEAGTSWQYVSIDTHVAAMALRAATGKTLHQLFEDTYGATLGFGKAPYYLTDGEDVAFALGGLNLRTRDYAKFGQLFLQDGQWNGKQIVPSAWVEDSTTNHAPIFHPERGTGYGYQWWVPMPQEGAHKGDFFAVGIYGQYIYINPRHNIVIAKNAADREFTQAGKSGQTSIEDNIDMFRSLAGQLYQPSIKTFSASEFDSLKSEIKGDEARFGEVFGIRTTKNLPPTEDDWSLIRNRVLTSDIDFSVIRAFELGNLPDDMRSEAFKKLYATARVDFIQRQQDIANEATDLGMSQKELLEIYETMLRENKKAGLK